ncbi:MAG: putative bifunctional diguanylate cyclase/phosphodiesterase [Eggerthellaceae bacterium]|jgi:diguanylate cyclase (GGDEF)-like protein
MLEIIVAVALGTLATYCVVQIVSGSNVMSRASYEIATGSAILCVILLITLLILVGAHRVSNNRIEKELASADQNLLDLAERDDLTLLYNHSTAITMLDSLKPEDDYTLMMLDVDHFKDINDTYGHDFGDRVLQEIARKLSDYLAPFDAAIARYGGDEFSILVRGCRPILTEALLVGMRDAIHEPIHIGVDSNAPTVCIGVTYSEPDTPPREALVHADIALHEAKKLGCANCMVFSKEMQSRVNQENDIKRNIREAIQNDGFYMVYQPRVNAGTLQVTGYEALVRMKGSSISPEAFIPIAEENVWLRRIGRITTEQVVRQIGEWQAEGKRVEPVSINFSSVQVSDVGYFDFLIDLLNRYDVSPNLVEIEITERMMFGFTQETIDLLNRFKTLGIRLLMDDFGTGYSSLSYLTNLPLDGLKIDKSFLHGNIESEDHRKMMADIIQLSHDLGMEATIEGVETRKQYDYVKSIDADTIQGFYFSKPLPPGKAIDFEASLTGE